MTHEFQNDFVRKMKEKIMIEQELEKAKKKAMGSRGSHWSNFIYPHQIAYKSSKTRGGQNQKCPLVGCVQTWRIQNAPNCPKMKRDWQMSLTRKCATNFQILSCMVPCNRSKQLTLENPTIYSQKFVIRGTVSYDYNHKRELEIRRPVFYESMAWPHIPNTPGSRDSDFLPRQRLRG